jgi:DNA modification methylase
MFSFVGDTVLDPFWGTGTTTAAAIDAHRSSIGYEIEPAYLKMGKDRFRQRSMDALVDFTERPVELRARASR